MIDVILQIILGAVITERLLEGLHKFYWTKRLKIYLIGNAEDVWEQDGITSDVKREDGIVKDEWLREFISCKFCQSWWMAWFVSFMVTLVWSGWSLHCIWMGLVTGALANRLHDIGDAIKMRRS